MFEIVVGLTAVIIAAAMTVGYLRTRDPLTPAVIFGPMLAYMYVYHPAMLVFQDQAENYLAADQLNFVLLVNLIGVAAFCAGCVGLRGAPRVVPGQALLPLDFPPMLRRKFRRLGIGLGVLATGTWIVLVQQSGGFAEVFSQGKPHVRVPTGYVSAVIMMQYPAIILLGLGLQGSKVRAHDVLLVLMAGLPHLMMGTIGGRRGPLFMIVCTMGMWWFLASNRRPRLRTVLVGLVFLGLAMLFLVATRQSLHLGTTADDIDTDRFRAVVLAEERSTGDEFLSGAATILVSDYHDQYFWGTRWVMLTLVRPIPSAIWPTQYEDMGFGWMGRDAGRQGFTDAEWREAVGYLPVRGSANGLVADYFQEFSWFGMVLLYVTGRIYVAVWRRSMTLGGIWVMLYIQMLGFSVYLVSQSFGAWSWRLLLIALPTILMWRRIISPILRRVPIPNPVAPEAPPVAPAWGPTMRSLPAPARARTWTF